MTRSYNERRNRRVIVMVERRRIPPKEVAFRLGLSHANVRWIIFCWRRSLTKPNTPSVALTAQSL